MSLRDVATLLWAIFAVYWLIAPRGDKAKVYRQPLGARVVADSALVIGSVLLFWRRISSGWLSSSPFPRDLATGVAGIAICAAGLILAVWARRILGAYWSGEVAIKEEHRLVQDGPYRIVRHPIYAGILLMVLGTALFLNLWRGFLAIPFFLIGIVLRIRAEEAALSQHFLREFQEYAKHTAMLVPWLL